MRELKETCFRLRVLRLSGILTEPHDPIIEENRELIRIVATVIEKTPNDTTDR